MYSQAYKTNSKLSTKNFMDLLYSNNFSPESFRFESLNIQNLPELIKLEAFLANQSEEYLFENYQYLKQLQKDIEQFTCLLNQTKNYLNSVKLIFRNVLVQKLS